MKDFRTTLWMAVTALASSAAGARSAALPAAGDCKDREKFGEFYDSVLSDVKSKTGTSKPSWSQGALTQLAQETQSACPELPWKSIVETAQKIAQEDMAIKLGTTEEYLFAVFVRQYKSAAQNAIASCGGAVDLNRCLHEAVCKESGSSSCVCMTPEQKSGRPMCQ